MQFDRRTILHFSQHGSGGGEAGEESCGILIFKAINFLGNGSDRLLYRQAQYISPEQYLLSSRKTQQVYLASNFSYSFSSTGVCETLNFSTQPLSHSICVYTKKYAAFVR